MKKALKLTLCTLLIGVGLYSLLGFLIIPGIAQRVVNQQLAIYATLPAREVAALLAKVARAVHHAHQRGVLHRDLKPGNILLDAAGEPWLTDFGLAKVTGADSSLTLTKDHIGTPHYMAPEIAGGNARAVSTASDVWALGVMLWEMLCGVPPFHGPGPVEIMRRILATAAIVIVATLLNFIPVPGLSAGPLNYFNTNGFPSDAGVRLSLGALSLNPVLSALITVEVLKLASPLLLEWLGKRPGNRNTLNQCILALGLANAALQAYGIAVTLEGIPGTDGIALVENPGAEYRITYVMTLVAAVALLYWLSELITAHGIGSGFWLMFVCADAAMLPTSFKQIEAQYAVSQIDGETLIWIGAWTFLTIVAAVILHRLRMPSIGKNTQESRIAPIDIMMPGLLGVWVASAFGMFLPAWRFASGADNTPALVVDPASPGLLTLYAAMIVLFAYLRAAVHLDSGDRHAQAVRWAIITGLVTAACTVVLTYVSVGTAANIVPGYWLIALTVVCLSILPPNVEKYLPDQPVATAQEEP